MPTNDFIGFASAGSANIMSQADYAAAAEQTDGVQPGPASSALANKIWRQGANMAAAIGGAIVDQGFDAKDDGDIATLMANVKKTFLKTAVWAIENGDSQSIPNSTLTNLCSYTFTKTGIYLIQGTVWFAPNSSGIRRLVISNTATGNYADRFSRLSINPAGGSEDTVLQFTTFISISTANTTKYLNCLQTSGAALTVNQSGMLVYRLGDI